VVKDELKQEIKRNQELFASTLNLQPTDTALFVNGMFFDLDVVDVISLLEVVRQELRVMEGLHKIGACFAAGCGLPDNVNVYAVKPLFVVFVGGLKKETMDPGKQ
jgi:hypothetical protein